MRFPRSSLVVAVLLLGVGAYAFTRDPPSPPEHPAAEAPVAQDVPGMQEPQTEGVEDEDDPDDEAGAIVWAAPAAWPEAPNPSVMRLATYRVPHAKGDADDAELSVARAGGADQANIDRWMGQFTQQAGAPRRADRTAGGLRVAVVSIEGTYEGGMGASSTPHPGWAMLAAIVDTPGLHYFFKLTGPAATVRASRPAFEAMLDSVRPAKTR